VDIALKEWFMEVGESDARFNGSILGEKSEQVSRKLGKHNLVTTEGWFQR